MLLLKIDYTSPINGHAQRSVGETLADFQQIYINSIDTGLTFNFNEFYMKSEWIGVSFAQLYSIVFKVLIF